MLDLQAVDLVSGTLFQTQYIIWSNYGVGVGGADEDLSAYQLTTRIFDEIGMKGGPVTEYHREHRGLEGYQDGLELLEYDLLYGDRVAFGGENPYAKTDMKMGLEEIVVDEVVYGDVVAEIRGSGFTEYSVVYIDGKRSEDTVYVSPDTLLITNTLRRLRPENRITVCQTGEDRIILSTAVQRP